MYWFFCSIKEEEEKKKAKWRYICGNLWWQCPNLRSETYPRKPLASTTWPNNFWKSIKLYIWYGENGVVYHKLLKWSETVNTIYYHQQIISLNHVSIKKCPEWATIHWKEISLLNNVPSHTLKVVRDIIAVFVCELLYHPPYSLDWVPVPSNYHLISSMSHVLSMKYFNNYKHVKKWLGDWITSKHALFFSDCIHNLLTK